MNLLSVGAAYGLMVLVFQKGVGADLLGFTQVDTIEAWVPLFLFSLLFGLSMDYQVFLLSRIKERFDQTGDTREAVAHGIGRTAGIITGAAAIMVCVFGGMATGDLVDVPADGLRPRGRDLPRRDRRAHDHRAGRHGAARRLELVPAALARVAAERERRGSRALHAPARRRPRARLPAAASARLPSRERAQHCDRVDRESSRNPSGRRTKGGGGRPTAPPAPSVSCIPDWGRVREVEGGELSRTGDGGSADVRRPCARLVK